MTFTDIFTKKRLSGKPNWKFGVTFTHGSMNLLPALFVHYPSKGYNHDHHVQICFGWLWWIFGAAINVDYVRCECGKLVSVEKAVPDDEGCWSCPQCHYEMHMKNAMKGVQS